MSEREDVVETVEVQTEAVAAQPIANGIPQEGTGQQPVADLGKVRELVLKAHPDVVPDLVAGSSVDELIASVEPARTAYQRIADQVRTVETGVGGRTSDETSDSASGNGLPTSDPIVVQPPVVPAGGATNMADPGDLGPTTKIAQALAARKTK
jgi:hypothetical protein